MSKDGLGKYTLHITQPHSCDKDQRIAALEARTTLDQATLEAVARVRQHIALAEMHGRRVSSISPEDLYTILNALQPEGDGALWEAAPAVGKEVW